MQTPKKTTLRVRSREFSQAMKNKTPSSTDTRTIWGLDHYYCFHNIIIIIITINKYKRKQHKMHAPK
jgi:hypothetical protein